MSETPNPLFVSFCMFLSQDINKRLSLPADIRLPEGYLEKFAMNSPPFDKPMSRRLRRASLVSTKCSVFICISIHNFPTESILFVNSAVQLSFSLYCCTTKLRWPIRCVAQNGPLMPLYRLTRTYRRSRRSDPLL